MLKFLTDLFDDNKKKLDKYSKIVEQINNLEPTLKKLSDEKLAAQTKKFKTQIAKNLKDGKSEAEALDEILVEAFATVREASRRVLGMRHFDVQLLAGIALHKKNITEQKTGEGKTLTVTAPLYLNALLGKGAHLITVNDYLAEIGAGWMGALYNFLGLSTAVVIHDQSKMFDPNIVSEDRGDERLEHFANITRQEAYLADITYGTNNEFGFDYLRDNMVQTLSQMTQRQDYPHHYAIVDEADSILIDEARTPLIISAPDSEPTAKYYEYAKLVQTLVKDIDYKVDEKAKTANLTDLGVKRIEQKLGVNNLYEESFDTIHLVESSLKAKTLYSRDKEYIVRENQVVIVDEHTGRLMFGRRYSDGLHQSIEAKEGVPIQQESRTLATISIQNYFRMYHKLSGMTGTAATEAEEFKKIYNTEVLVIPTNQSVVRIDRPDVVYKTTAAKYSAIVKEIEEIHAQGRPILVGTKSIEHNQIISNFLKRKKIEHQLLNAKNNEKEAFIIADAGKKNSITVATNIAGRGVDIVLGGAKPEIKDFKKEKAGGKVDEGLVKSLNLPPAIDPSKYKLKEYAKALTDWKKAHEEVVSLGGLHIIGTERHESRRIDNQLRGRSGRQGDAGSSQFFLSLEDDIMRIFGGEQISKVMDFLKIEENQPIEHGMIGKAIESAQVKVEGFFFDQRKRLVDFDDVMNKHREIIYKRRRRLLELGSDENKNAKYQDDNLRDEILTYLHNEVEEMVTLRAPQSFTPDEYEAIVKEFTKLIPFDSASQRELQRNLSQKTRAEEIIGDLNDIIDQTYEAREKTMGKEMVRQIENYVVLASVDEKWMEHLENMDSLKEGIWLRGDKNMVLSEYKKEAFTMFEGLIGSIESTIASRIFRVQPAKQQPIRVMPKQVIESKPSIADSLEAEVEQAQAASMGVSGSSSGSTQGSISDLAAALKTAKAPKKVSPGVKYEKIGRNDPCPCGSGKKYKKCHMLIDGQG